MPAADRGFIGVVERSTGHLRVRSVYGYADPSVWRAARVAPEGPLTLAMAERRLLLLAGQKNGAIREGTAGVGERSWAIAPLTRRGGLIGLLVLQAAPERAFSPADRPFLEIIAGLVSLALERAQMEKELEQLTRTDPLTGLYNRNALLEIGRQELSYALHYGRPLALLALDIDGMAAINGAHGFAVGNHVLREVGRRLRRNLRAADILAREGEDCFLALVLAVSADDAHSVAERLRQVVAQTPVHTAAGPIEVTVSVGVALSEGVTGGVEELVQRARSAMRVVQDTGGNGVKVWSESLRRQRPDNRTVTVRLPRDNRDSG